MLLTDMYGVIHAPEIRTQEMELVEERVMVETCIAPAPPNEYLSGWLGLLKMGPIRQPKAVA